MSDDRNDPDWYVEYERLSALYADMLASFDGVASFDWSQWPRTPDGNLACMTCQGRKGCFIPASDGIPATTFLCSACCGTGLFVVDLINHIRVDRMTIDDLYDDKRYLTDFIEKTSTCKTCRGNSHKTFIGMPCEECGLIGNMPAGG